ncbi:MAG: hypothetical protein RLZZ184_2941 [Cyanobacteriota bacterium]|jgi:exopolysaccharide biosynthesis polyprenyl glycosylphosphotransferase
MIFERQKGFYALHVIFQTLVTTCAFLGWFYFIKNIYGKELSGGFASYSIYAIVTALAVLVLAIIDHRHSQALLMGNIPKKVILGLRQSFGITVLLLFFLVATKDKAISRLFVFSWVPLIIAILPISNIIIPWILRPLIFNGASSERCLLISFCNHESKSVGRGEPTSGELKNWLDHQKKYGLRYIGGLWHDKQPIPDLGVLKLGAPEEFSNVLEETKATSLILLQMPPQKETLTNIIDVCEALAVRCTVVHDFQEHFGRPIDVLQVHGMNLLQFRREPLQNPLNRFIKRTFDLIISMGVVCLLLPVIVVILGPIYWIQSPGPIFFRQTRAGRKGRIFTIYKFRSMHNGGHREEMQATSDDKRIFPLGSLLRKTSIDEFPQFINVLKGEMSVVGPRPHLQVHNDIWEKEVEKFHIRSLVKPGITGLAQTRGYRGEASSIEDIQKRVECDIEYIEKWSIFYDIGIVIKTALQVLFPHRNAY